MLSPRELATVLAALRSWQLEHLRPVPVHTGEHFAEHSPLTLGEIDQLCERLNFGMPKHSPSLADVSRPLEH